MGVRNRAGLPIEIFGAPRVTHSHKFITLCNAAMLNTHTHIGHTVYSIANTIISFRNHMLFPNPICPNCRSTWSWACSNPGCSCRSSDRARSRGPWARWSPCRSWTRRNCCSAWRCQCRRNRRCGPGSISSSWIGCSIRFVCSPSWSSHVGPCQKEQY